MAWQMNVVINDVNLVIQTMTGFYGLLTDSPEEVLGFPARDQQITDMIRNRDPCLFDVLNQALDTLDELTLVGWSTDSLWWDEYLSYRKDTETLERQLEIINCSEYASPDHRQRALDTLDKLHCKQARKDHLKRRRSRFQQMRQERILALIKRDGLVCAKCSTAENLTVDHIIPISKGGTDDLDNLRLLCRSCNSKKGDRTDE